MSDLLMPDLPLSDFAISQILALGTLFCGMAAFQFRERTVILRVWCIAALFGAAHFWFLDAFEAALLVSVTAARFFVSSLTTDKRLFWLFILLAVAGWAWTYQSPVSFLALGATLIGTWGSFHGTDTAIRWAMMGAEVLWMIYNIIIWSPVAVGMEVLFFASNLIGMLRHRRARESAL